MQAHRLWRIKPALCSYIVFFCSVPYRMRLADDGSMLGHHLQRWPALNHVLNVWNVFFALKHTQNVFYLCCFNVGPVSAMPAQHKTSEDKKYGVFPANTTHWTDGCLMLGRRLRRWPSIKPTWIKCMVVAVVSHTQSIWNASLNMVNIPWGWTGKHGSAANVWMHERMEWWVYGWIGRVNRWMGEWKESWVDEWFDR